MSCNIKSIKIRVCCQYVVQLLLDDLDHGRFFRDVVLVVTE